MTPGDNDQHLLRAVRLAARVPRRHPLVLMYHAFGSPPGGDDPYDLFLPTTNLERQVDLLLAGGWQPTSLDEFIASYDQRQGTGLFHVTIDDGFESVLTEAAPILSHRGVPATLFVLAGLIGQTSSWLSDMPHAPLLSREQLVKIRAAGVTVEVHGHDHQELTSMDSTALRRNTHEARETVTELAGARPRAFAYPFGWHDAPSRRAVAAAGFDIAFSLYDDHGRFAVSRVDVKPGDSLATFCVKLLPAYRRVWRTVGALAPVRRGLRRLTDRIG